MSEERMTLPIRRFDHRKGDRVARKPNSQGLYFDEATKDWNEAIVYATQRARLTKKRQRLKKWTNHGWWIVYAVEEDG